MSPFYLTLTTAMVVLSICLVLTAVRFAVGPTLPDRVAAFDLIVANVIGIIAIYTEFTNNEDFIDVAIILSLFGFLGSISFAYYLMKINKS
ncbi:multisubunit sodium/proton antiporter MrpF subunit [Pontibacter ummariensis]|uniref:Multisubunit sodium/proton antiporter, MrpF subunit n=1 Tax=Pontibacter ummariensis TaxID=1610492 RepID=A0A239BVU0_9BACT|nr:monovalent cation/H+ antiporter complex subunit F [Pontibacter ummariensis]PRY15590.1 multisubunit sodium/proton antiporter MrpF subunit [Pontibacter ummariensis]SNS12020.1 multisubunit sodium/proton antiporter, MrpF subunit [Pontibacter ummariensis]